MLGRGGFSEVYKAFDLVEFGFVAVKIHQLNSAWNRKRKESYTKHACREYNIQRTLKHERVVRLIDVFEIDDNSFATVLEVRMARFVVWLLLTFWSMQYCGGDDLDSVLRRHGTLPEKEARHIVAQVLDGLCYLSSQVSVCV